MADLERLSVRALRDLARKHVGSGYSRLKTRGQLLDALAKALPVSAPGPAPQRPAAPAPTAAPALVAARANGKRLPSPAPAPIPAPVPAAPKRTPRAKKKVEATVRAADARRAPPTPPPAAPPAPPLPANFDEHLGELPESYGDDSVVLLPKDPHSLYLYWDLSPVTLDRSFAWMPGLRTRMRLLEGDRIVRDEDFSVSTRGYYFFNLPSGHIFRAEMLALAEDGQVRRIGPRSNPVRLPGVGPSGVRDDRFVRIPLDLAPSRVAEALRIEFRHKQPPSQPQAQAQTQAQAQWQGQGPRAPGGPSAPARSGAPGLPGSPSRPAAGPSLRPRHAVPVGVSGPSPRAASPGLEALVAAVEPPPFSEARRERIYQASGGAARPVGSSEAFGAPRVD